MSDKTMAFTGYRPHKLPWGSDEESPACREFLRVLDAFLNSRYEEGYRNFITGMAIGIDTLCAIAVLKLKREKPDVFLEAAIPCVGQESAWSGEDISRYKEILSQCNKVSVLEKKYVQGCMQKRNRYMVDHSDALLAVFDGKSGGTYQTLMYAADRGKILFLIDPKTLAVRSLRAGE